jgi:parvulin-like peptidyl-prolyl isomerase
VKKLTLPLSVLVVAALLALASGCSSSGGLGSGAAATVNGTDISMNTLYDDLAVLAKSPSYKANLEQNGTQVYGSDGKTYTTEFASGWLSVLIQSTLVEQQLQSLGGEPTPDETAQAQKSYSQLASSGEVPQSFIDRLVAANANQLALKRVIEASAPAAAVSDEDVQAYYDQNIDSIMQQAGGDVACVALVAAQIGSGQAAPTAADTAAATAQIDDVAARVRAGEDLSTIASGIQSSGTGDLKGAVTCLPKGSGQLPQSVEDAIYAAPVGQVSSPVQTDTGVFLFVVRTRGVVPLDEIRDGIRQQLEQNKTDVTQQKATEFLQAATIEVDPRFGTFDTTKAEVVPPNGPTSASTTVPLVDQFNGAATGTTDQSSPTDSTP